MSTRGRYGHFSYGSAEPRRVRKEQRYREWRTEEGPRPEVRIYGTGFDLASADDPESDFDLQSDSTTKTLALSSGIDHFATDLAVKVVTIGLRIIGQLANRENAIDLEFDVKDALVRDDRVNRVTDVTVDPEGVEPDTITVEATLIATDGTQHTTRQPVPTRPTNTIRIFT